MRKELIRYKAVVEYCGSGLCGWQKQLNLPSVQGILESVIYNFTKQEVEVFCAGRTDRGVHALGQVIHFDLCGEYDARKLIRSLNHFLRGTNVAILDCEAVDMKFHARFSAKSRSYLYKILNRNVLHNPVYQNRVSVVYHPLDVELMQLGANELVGTYDFTSFRAANCQANSAIRTMSEIKIWREAELITCYFHAPSFLYHMVRNIMGTLILVGAGKMTPRRVKEILLAKDRSIAGPTAKPEGLYFLRVNY
ncbi:tRNA pseudouridine synthase A [Rickettsiales endosymbiont of Paramecium tredecaurelia]|uniref:tRNA pseudouridine(38-40) synthase TruA n=1 Tax=Candidatus Sarmatiella mevalonica TaxID=2770581 RepID=UPI0019237985|nr:tRNA pseudouridine(38-40) synthase TruA [Candidatus Sarmatiella mevalonica]MBL3284295.1 tRNA pseudouridine synthase A [Candidatus Sarmatiella mevalonica]